MNGVPARLDRRSRAAIARAAASALLAAVSAALLPAPARAGDPPPAQPSATLITIGSYGVYMPRFEGSRRYEIGPWPILSWRSEGSREWLELPRDGWDYALVETDRFRFGPVGYLRWQRDNDTLPARGFARVGRNKSSIDLSVEGGAFAEYWPADWLRTRIEVREGIVGANGLIANLSSDLVWRPDRQWTFSAGPRMSIADRTFMRDYYAVDFHQSVASGLPVYAPDAGLRSVGAGTFVRYRITPQITTQAFAEYEHLTGPAGDSPVITARGSREQLMLGVGLSYTFRAPW